MPPTVQAGFNPNPYGVPHNQTPQIAYDAYGNPYQLPPADPYVEVMTIKH
jgi:hypothetical protein